MAIHLYSKCKVNSGKYTIHVLDFHSCTHLAPIANGFDFTPSRFPQFAFRRQISPAGLGDLLALSRGCCIEKKETCS